MYRSRRRLEVMGMDERTVLNGNSVGEEFSIFCIRCDNETKHDVVTSVDITETFNLGHITEWTSLQILQCRGCETHSFRSSTTSTEDTVQDFAGETYQVVDSKVYPPRMAGRRKLRSLWYLPSKVKNL